jgi:hypothetical protein
MIVWSFGMGSIVVAGFARCFVSRRSSGCRRCFGTILGHSLFRSYFLVHLYCFYQTFRFRITPLHRFATGVNSGCNIVHMFHFD